MIRVAFLYALCLAGSHWPTLALAEERPNTAGSVRCHEISVVVRAANGADVALVCAGAGDAIAFLASQGLDVDGPIAIEVTPTLPPDCGPAVGCFLEASQRIFVLTYPAFLEQASWFRSPPDRALYRSLVSHEVAHVIGARNFKIRMPWITAKEYIAYVTMFSTMPPTTRAKVLARFPGQAFEGDWQMSTTIYLADPMHYGARAYRHFLLPGNGRGYLHRVLAGEAGRGFD